MKDCLYSHAKDIHQFVFPDKRVLAIYSGPDIFIQHCRYDNMIFLTIPDKPKEIKVKEPEVMIQQIPRP
jgi:hypothetical protein